MLLLIATAATFLNSWDSVTGTVTYCIVVSFYQMSALNSELSEVHFRKSFVLLICFEGNMVSPFPFISGMSKPTMETLCLGWQVDSQCSTSPYATLNIVSTIFSFDKYCQLVENWMINDSLRLWEKRCSISRHFDNLISYKWLLSINFFGSLSLETVN